MKTLFTLIGLFTISILNAQSIWQENFESYAQKSGISGIDATDVGDYPASVPFIIDLGDAELLNDNDYVRVGSSELQIRDVDEEVVITFDPVDISSQTGDVTITFGKVDFNIRSNSSNWSEGDYIDILYSLDNGTTFTLFPDHMGSGDMDHTFITPTGLMDGEDFDTTFAETIDPGTATSIILQLKLDNSGANEEFELDDIDISRNTISLWSEDFSSYIDPSGIVGVEGVENSGDYPSGITSWTLTPNANDQLEDSGDFIWVTNSSENGTNVLKVNDINDPVVFETVAIDITGISEVSFAMDINFDETTYEASDYVDILYSIDNGMNFIRIQDDGNGRTFSGDNINTNLNTPATRNVDFLEIIGSLTASSIIFRIEASNNSSSEDYEFDNLELTNGNVLSITENSLDNNFKVYPNPTKNILNIEYKDQLTTNHQMKLYNSIGKEVFSQESNQLSTSLQLPILPSGIYFFIINKNGRSVFNQKLVIR